MHQQKRNINIFNQSFIRNISIISHVDHGKTTLSDYLLASGGLLPEYLAGTLRALDSLPEEQRRGITIETSLASYTLNFNDEEYLINVIDTPGHVDFSGKVAESLRLVDGSLIIVDAVEGIMAQTKSVLKQAIAEKIVFILFINKIDRLIKELELSADQAQIRIQKIISEIYIICQNSSVDKHLIPNFTRGTILLGSALDGWAIDIDYVNSGKNITDIIKLYENEKFQLNDSIKLSKTVNKAIINKFPSPKEGQKNKFPSLLKTDNDEYTSILTTCDTNNDPILIIGRQERNTNNIKNSFISRVLSGSIKKGISLYSSLSNKSVKIIRVSQVYGRTKQSTNEIRSGNICSIAFSDHLISGDILTNSSSVKILLNDISYIQEPVVAIGIEPLQIKQIGKLQRVVAEICEYTPGLFFEINKVTGELIILGVGTLQLDVLSNELKEANFDIEISTPIVISYEMPLENKHVQIVELDINYFAGDKIPYNYLNYKEVYSDENNNILCIKTTMNKDGLDGIIEVFRQSVRVSPKSGKRIKNFVLIIENDENDSRFNKYEDAMIIGSKIIKNALVNVNALIHEPYYDIEILLPEKYIGPILQELQRMKSIISDVISKKDDSKIIASISVKEAILMADKLRQLSDGNAFWAFTSVKFLPINSF